MIHGQSLASSSHRLTLTDPFNDLSPANKKLVRRILDSGDIDNFTSLIKRIEFHNRGNFTVCILAENFDGSTINDQWRPIHHVGVAKCCPDDTFNNRAGTGAALKDALLAFCHIDRPRHHG